MIIKKPNPQGLGHEKYFNHLFLSYTFPDQVSDGIPDGGIVFGTGILMVSAFVNIGGRVFGI